MDVTLCLGFYCHIYKTPPTIRIYINDFFIDEFEILESIEKNKTVEIVKDIDDLRRVSKMSISELAPTFGYLPRKIDKNLQIKFYDIKNLHCKNESVKIKVEVKNNDSNFTNGFFTNSTLLSLPMVFITPTKILKNFKFFLKKYEKMYKKRTNISNNIHTIKKFYKTAQNFISPFTDQSLNFYHEKSRKYIQSLFFGGSGYFNFVFNKKHNVFVEKPHIGYRKLGQKDSGYLLSLSDKYNQYAN